MTHNHRVRNRLPARALPAAFVVGLSALLLLPLQAGAAAQDRNSTASDSTRVEVSRVLLDVVVTDKKDVPLSGMRADEFHLIIDGHEEPIDAFEDHCTLESSEGTEPPPGREASRQMILFFDMSHLKIGGRRQAIRVADDFVEHMMTSEDRVMALAFSKGLYIISPFTNDRQVLLSRLAGLENDKRLIDTAPFEEENTLGHLSTLSGMWNWNRTPGLARGAILSHGISGECWAEAKMAEMEGARTMCAIANTMPAFADVPGRKALMLFSETLRGDPGEVYYHACNVSAGDRPSLDYTIRPEMEDLIERANLAGVTFYPMHVGGLSAGPTGDIMREALDFQAGAALRTGGEHFVIMRNPLQAFTRAREDLSCHYVLVFRPTEKLRTGRHGVEIHVTRKKTRLRYRESFVTETPAEAGEREMLAVLSNPGLYKDLKVEAHGYTLADTRRGQTDFLVQASVSASDLQLLPLGPGKGRRTVSYRGAVISDKPAVECDFRDTLELESSTAGPEHSGIQALCTLDRGEHEIIVAARDEIGGALGTFWGKINVQPARERESLRALLWTPSAVDPWSRATDSGILPGGSKASGGGAATMIVRSSITLDAGEGGLVTYLACREHPKSRSEDADADSAFTLRMAGPTSLILPARAIGEAELSPCALVEAEIPPGALSEGTYLAIPIPPKAWRSASDAVKIRVLPQ